jgi:hypoxanthine phosphoribosyltransferase
MNPSTWKPKRSAKEARAIVALRRAEAKRIGHDPGREWAEAEYRKQRKEAAERLIAAARPPWNPSMPSRGLGDTVAKITHAIGLDKLAKGVARLLGKKDCGCSKRQSELNQAVPYVPPKLVPIDVPLRTWITTARLAKDTGRLCSFLPHDFDAILGIARSGLMPGTQIATALHLPLYAVGPWYEAEDIRLVGGGWRISGEGPLKEKPVKRVLMVDDTAHGGHAIRLVSALARERWPGVSLRVAVIYAHPKTLPLIDYAACTYRGYHYLEWNLFNTGHAEHLATDLDGILCDEKTGTAIHRPVRLPVPLIVTGRSQCVRPQTEAWLAANGIRYNLLVMGPWEEPLPDLETIGRWKGGIYRDSECRLFVESDPTQAKAIFQVAGKEVLCPALGGIVEA